ncbi:hypothetical protein [Paenibacillus ottowii]
MDNKQVPIEVFNTFVFGSFKFLGLYLLITIVWRYFFKVRLGLMDKVVTILKVIGYLSLAIAAYFFTYEDGKIVPEIPESLSLSQCFVIILAIFETISNLLSLFKGGIKTDD